MTRPDHVKPLDAMRMVFSADHKLSESERAVLAVLVSHRNNRTGLCYPGQPRIAEESGMTVPGVQGILARLDGAGIIDREREVGRSTRYTLHLDQLSTALEPPNDVGPTPQRRYTHPPTTLVRTAVRTAKELSSAFEEVWKEYPRRAGGNSKVSARKAWDARVKSVVDPQAMVEGVRGYAAFIKADGKEGTVYVKHAATFFGPDEHWEDDYALPTNGVNASGAKVGPGGRLLTP